MKSIIQSDKYCYVCGTTANLELHHCIHGTANRRLADKYGLTVWLCHSCHQGSRGVHHNWELDDHLKQLAQTRFERVHGKREDWMRVFGRNYL